MSEWYASTPNGDMIGPFQKKELLAMVRTGTVERDCMVCRANGSTWVALVDEPEFAKATRRAPTLVGKSAPKEIQQLLEDSRRAQARGEALPGKDAPPREPEPSRPARSQPAIGGLLAPDPSRQSSPSQSRLARPPAKPPPIRHPVEASPVAQNQPQASQPQATPSQPPAAPSQLSLAGSQPEAALGQPQSSQPHAEPTPQQAAPSQPTTPPNPVASVAPAAVVPSSFAAPSEQEIAAMRGGGGLAGALAAIGLVVTLAGAAFVFVGGSDTAERQGLGVMLLGVALIAFAAVKKR